MVKVLVVTNMYPPHHYGGYELLCRDTAERFRERGHDVSILTSDWRVAGVADDADEDPDRVRRRLRLYWDDHELVTPPWRTRLAIERGNQHALTAALDEVQPDVVSVWHMGAMSMGLLTTIAERGIPIVAHIGDDWLTYGVRLDPWARVFANRPRLARLVATATGLPTRLPDLASAGTWCFVSERTRRFADERSPWSFEGSPIVFAGVDERDFPILDAPPERPWRWRILYTGRIDERKGIASLVDAVAALPAEATLTILGRGDDDHLAALHRHAREQGVADRVRFDAVPRAELQTHYQDADALVFPSTWDEPFGIVPLEAMACGTPVVATGRGGSGEFLEDGRNCLLFQPGDAHALAAALTRLHDDPGLRRRIVEGGLATARSLTVERVADELESFHLAAAGSAGQPSTS